MAEAYFTRAYLCEVITLFSSSLVSASVVVHQMNLILKVRYAKQVLSVSLTYLICCIMIQEFYYPFVDVSGEA